MPDGRREEATPAPPDTFAPVANAYLRFAWEANVARADEVIACGFDPEELEPRSWSSLKDVGQGLERIRDRSLPLLPSFELTDAIADLVDTGSVGDTREYRNAVVHRARPCTARRRRMAARRCGRRGGSASPTGTTKRCPEVSDDAPGVGVFVRHDPQRDETYVTTQFQPGTHS